MGPRRLSGQRRRHGHSHRHAWGPPSRAGARPARDGILNWSLAEWLGLALCRSTCLLAACLLNVLLRLLLLHCRGRQTGRLPGEQRLLQLVPLWDGHLQLLALSGRACWCTTIRALWHAGRRGCLPRHHRLLQAVCPLRLRLQARGQARKAGCWFQAICRCHSCWRCRHLGHAECPLCRGLACRRRAGPDWRRWGGVCCCAAWPAGCHDLSSPLCCRRVLRRTRCLWEPATDAAAQQHVHQRLLLLGRRVVAPAHKGVVRMGTGSDT